MLQKIQFEEEKQGFSFKMLNQYAEKAFLFLAECCFSARELLEFFKK